MDIDRKTILGLLLIGLIIIFTNTDLYKKLVFGESVPMTQQDEFEAKSKRTDLPSAFRKDSLDFKKNSQERLINPSGSEVQKQDGKDILLSSFIDDYNLKISSTEERIIEVETPLYFAKFSTKGPSIVSWTLKDYFKADSLPVQVIYNESKNLYLSFPIEGDSLSLSEFVYTVDYGKNYFNLSESNSSQDIALRLDLGDGRAIKYVFTFHHDKYSFDMNIEIVNFEKFVDGLTYSVNFTSGINSSEQNYKDDMSNAKAYALARNEIEDFDIGDDESGKKELKDWTINWAAVRTKYFSTAIIPTSNTARGVILKGKTKRDNPEALFKKYDIELLMPYNRKKTNDQFTVYLGPLKYSTLQSYDIGLENMMSLGPSFIRFLGKIVLWSITQLYKIIPNYGIVIIIFSILVKLVLHPLTKKSFQSMKEMQKVQPLMQELKEKYSKDPQKMNAEVMRLYKEHGVNPLGGCLPMLLQLPLLYSLFAVFRTTIEFRGAPFFGWINDLSGPDTLTTIPFLDVPLNVLPLVMGLTMFLQQKSTITDPKQKVMIYMMPGVMTFFFYSFPSGLNLYYTLFNLLTIFHQRVISDSKKGNDTTKKVKSELPKKSSRKKMSRLDMMRQISKSR